MDLAKQTEEADFAFTANDTVLISIWASDWLADSAATTHITRNKSDFIDYSEITTEIEGNNTRCHTWDQMNWNSGVRATQQLMGVTQADDGDIQSKFIDKQLAKGSHLMMGISKEKSLRTHHQWDH